MQLLAWAKRFRVGAQQHPSGRQALCPFAHLCVQIRTAAAEYSLVIMWLPLRGVSGGQTANIPARNRSTLTRPEVSATPYKAPEEARAALQSKDEAGGRRSLEGDSLMLGHAFCCISGKLLKPGPSASGQLQNSVFHRPFLETDKGDKGPRHVFPKLGMRILVP